MEIKRGILLYSAIIMALFFGAINFWFIISNLTYRQIGLNSIIMVFDALLILFSVLIVRISFPENQKIGVFSYYSILSFSLLLVTIITLLNPSQLDIVFYNNLSILALLILMGSFLDNVLKLFKFEGGFYLPIHNSEKIPSIYIIPVWIVCFIAFGLLVSLLGKALIGYPVSLASAGGVDNAIKGSLGVADWENIVFLVFFFVLAKTILIWRKIPIKIAIFIAILIGASAFTGYHAFVYSSDFNALSLVLFVSIFWLVIYAFTESLVPISGFHVGNNFIGIITEKSYPGATIPVSQAGFDVASLIIIFSISMLIYILWKGVNNEKNKH